VIAGMINRPPKRGYLRTITVSYPVNAPGPQEATSPLWASRRVAGFSRPRGSAKPLRAPWSRQAATRRERGCPVANNVRIPKHVQRGGLPRVPSGAMVERCNISAPTPVGVALRHDRAASTRNDSPLNTVLIDAVSICAGRVRRSAAGEQGRCSVHQKTPATARPPALAL
jgi:hypothetical protein